MLFPKPHLTTLISEDSGLLKLIWKELNKIPSETFISEGRIYGGGLHKIEPKELAKLPVGHLDELLTIRSNRRVKLHS